MDCPAESTKPCILLVDDYPEVINFVEYFLKERCGYQVFTATNGSAALAIAAQHKIDVALIDFDMPGMSGWEILDRFTKDPNLRQIHVLMMSGLVKPELVRRAVERGAREVFEKPFDVKRLVSAIQSYLKPDSPAIP
jgi:CheY-like chemotaxis protein